MMTRAPSQVGNLIREDQMYRQYHLDIEPGITLQDLLQPELWRLSTDGQVRAGDRVRVRSETERFDLELVCVAVLPKAGLIMRVHGAEAAPGTPLGERLRKAEAAARTEELVEYQRNIETALAGGKP